MLCVLIFILIPFSHVSACRASSVLIWSRDASSSPVLEELEERTGYRIHKLGSRSWCTTAPSSSKREAEPSAFTPFPSWILIQKHCQHRGKELSTLSHSISSSCSFLESRKRLLNLLKVSNNSKYTAVAGATSVCPNKSSETSYKQSNLRPDRREKVYN